MDHTFVICAYKESPYLEKCVQSVINQTVKSKVLISTSTPNDYINNIAQKYNLYVAVNKGKGDMADNFNFAYAQANSKYVTICHQDDYYANRYLECIQNVEKKTTNAIIFFTDYYEDRLTHIEKQNSNLMIKRMALYPLKFKIFRKSYSVRKFILKFGNPICCPTVLFNKQIVQTPNFDSEWLSVLDWRVWVALSKYEGEFCYVSQPLVYHRIHSESETTRTIKNNRRTNEEMAMYQEMWPKWFAKIISRIYEKGQKNN